MGSGVIVAARTNFAATVDSGLQTGDVIHALNGTPIISMDALNTGIKALKTGDSVVLQVERDGKLQFLSFEME